MSPLLAMVSLDAVVATVVMTKVPSKETANVLNQEAVKGLRSGGGESLPLQLAPAAALRGRPLCRGSEPARWR